MRFKEILIIIIITGFFQLPGCLYNDDITNIINNPSSYKKKVLVEFFTNSGCNPCVAAHEYLDGITALSGVTSNDTNVIIISYHTRYPYPYDSLYRANVPHNEARISYYGVSYTPQGRLDGVNLGQFNANDWTSAINLELSTKNYTAITLSKTYDTLSRTGNVGAQINTLSSIQDGDIVVHLVITENSVPYITAGNGVKYPNDVMRTLLTGENGEPITLVNGQQITINKDFTIQNNWNQENCYITIFFQSISSKAIYGVERIKVK
jgi:hypothetical protein